MVGKVPEVEGKVVKPVGKVEISWCKSKMSERFYGIGSLPLKRFIIRGFFTKGDLFDKKLMSIFKIFFIIEIRLGE
ncbi:hypothetical protein [Bacillus salipaludis]|uniref:hypothetical protein n=1 Tax=Bacillus salipaludis TaxID=2547811 RepID=UPI002E1A8106|nr:hypothetical protein [Bacillus salipaludis]